MARTSLAERQARLEQQRARLQREEAKVREAERKARTRRLIEVGGLVDKAGLGELGANVLYGALLEMAAKTDDPAQLARWKAAGGRAFDREAKTRDAGTEPLILTVEGSQPALVHTRLRKLGFRWSKVLRHWEGLAVHDEAKALAAEIGATLQRVAPGGPEETDPVDADGHGEAIGASAGPAASASSSSANAAE